MQNVYLILKRSVVVVLLLFCQIAIAHPADHGFSPVAADTLSPDTIQPVVKSFTPTSGKKGTIVAISGSGFTGVTSVFFGFSPANGYTVWNDSLIVAVVGVGSTGSILVTTTHGAATKAGFTFIQDTIPPADTPRIISFSPTSGRRGTAVIIFGTHFTGTTAARFGGVLADSIRVLSDSTIRAIVGNGATGNVSVTTPCGTASRPGFTFIQDTTLPDSARIYSFSPTSARRITEVTIKGKHFRYATEVKFGGVNAFSFYTYSDSIIVARVGNGASGNVTVNTLYNGFAFKSGFTFIPDTATAADSIPPHIYSFSKSRAKRRDTLYIRGHFFRDVNAVSFGGVPADNFSVLSDTLIRAAVGNGASGPVSVSSWIGSSSKNGFTFIPDSTGTPDSLARMVVGNATTTIDSKLFALYPNPASGYVIWQQPAMDHITRLQLFDISGSIVRTFTVGKRATQSTIPVSGLPTGMYKLVWSDGKNKLTRSLLIK